MSKKQYTREEKLAYWRNKLEFAAKRIEALDAELHNMTRKERKVDMLEQHEIDNIKNANNAISWLHLEVEKLKNQLKKTKKAR